MTTTLHKLRCQGCGASVPVKDGLRFVDCAYCGSRLEVVAPETTKKTMLISEVEASLLRGQLRELDSTWNRYFERVSVWSHGGVRRAPDSAYVTGHVTLGFFLTIISSICLALLSLWWVALAAPAGLWITWLFASAAKQRQRAFDSAQARYYTQRDELLAKLGAPMGTVPH